MSDADSVTAWIEDARDDLVEFVLEFGNEPSPRGHEAEASAFFCEWLSAQGLDARLQPVIGDRANVVATIPGDPTESGSDLVFNGHIDTAYGNPEEDEWVLPQQRRIDREAWRDGEYLMGDDVVNDKGPLAAQAFAGLALQETGVDLAGDLSITGTVGEIGGATIDEYQDYEWLAGTGIGTRRLVDGGVTGDYALVAEATEYAIARMECGVAWFKIELTGSATYQPLLALPDPETVEADHPGVVIDMAHATVAMEEWASQYCLDNTTEYDHGTVRPTAGVGALRTGNPFAPAKAPGRGALYLDVRLPPGETPSFVREDVASTLQDAGLDATVETYMFRRGYVADAEEVAGLTDPLSRAHDTIRAEEMPRPKPHVTSMWRDSNVFNEAGIPSVNFGPPRAPEAFSSTKKNNAMAIDDLVESAKIYALTAMDVCG